MPLLRQALHFWSVLRFHWSDGGLQLLLLPAKVVLAAHHVPPQMGRCLVAFGPSRPGGNFLSKGGRSSGKSSGSYPTPQHTHRHIHAHLWGRALARLFPSYASLLSSVPSTPTPCQFTSGPQQYAPLSLTDPSVAAAPPHFLLSNPGMPGTWPFLRSPWPSWIWFLGPNLPEKLLPPGPHQRWQRKLPLTHRPTTRTTRK